MTYLTLADVDLLWRPLTEQEQARAEALIPLIEGCLRQGAAPPPLKRRGAPFFYFL